MKFQVGDLVEYITFERAQPAPPLYLVVETRENAGNRPGRFTVRLHNVKTGTKAWDWAHAYGKVEK